MVEPRLQVGDLGRVALARGVISLPLTSSGTSIPRWSSTVGAMSVESTTPSVRVEAEVRLPPKPSPAIPAGSSCC